MMWSNNRIRVIYQIPLVAGECRAEFENDAKGPIGRKSLTKEEEVEVTFRRTPDSKMQIFFKYDDELKGLGTYFALFHTKEGKDLTKYNNWNFTTPDIWDSKPDANFWYSPNSTMLIYTKPNVLGKETLQKIDLPLQPETIVKKDKMITKRILGIPMGFADEHINNVIWGPTNNVNEDYQVPHKTVYNGTNSVI